MGWFIPAMKVLGSALGLGKLIVKRRAAKDAAAKPCPPPAPKKKA